MYLLGLDVGTQGARAVVADEEGNIVAESSRAFQSKRNSSSANSSKELPPGWFEQSPDDWWTTSKACIGDIIDAVDPGAIEAMSVTSTSGTFLPIDDNDRPLRPALMYNDSRASEEAEIVSDAGADLEDKLGYKFQPSFALPKMLWIKRNEPEIFSKTKRFLHASDFLIGKLTRDFSISDSSNALKSGFDLVDVQWGKWIEDKLGIPLEKFPKVVSPGDRIRAISRECANETGLSQKTIVVAGATDGTASFISSGAVEPGDWSSTLGTTIVVRGVSRGLVKDPLGRIYCHKHPEGYWLPGGASNVGCECLNVLFENEDLRELDKRAINISPTVGDLIVYPLVRKGERLPFLNVEADGFVVGEPASREELYTAYLEGVGFVERWIFELFESLGVEVGERIYIAGGGARSLEWTQIRANILGRALVKPKLAEAAFGAAILAGFKTAFNGLSSAVRTMVKIERAVEPQYEMLDKLDDRYSLFRNECKKRGMAESSRQKAAR